MDDDVRDYLKSLQGDAKTKAESVEVVLKGLRHEIMLASVLPEVAGALGKDMKELSPEHYYRLRGELRDWVTAMESAIPRVRALVDRMT